MQANTAAEKIFRIDAPGDQIGIGHRRLRAAFAVTSRARRGARAMRPDFQAAGGIDPGDAAAAVADLDDIDDRKHHRMARNITADVVAAGDLGMKIFDQARLRRRAAHVERNDMPDIERLSEMGRGDHPSHRPGLHHRHRHSFRGLGRHDAAVGLHHAEGAAETAVGQHFFQGHQIAPDERPDVRIEHRRRGPLIFPELAQNFMGQRNVDAGKLPMEQLADLRARARRWRTRAANTPRRFPRLWLSTR